MHAFISKLLIETARACRKQKIRIPTHGVFPGEIVFGQAAFDNKIIIKSFPTDRPVYRVVNKRSADLWAAVGQDLYGKVPPSVVCDPEEFGGNLEKVHEDMVAQMKDSKKAHEKKVEMNKERVGDVPLRIAAEQKAAAEREAAIKETEEQK